MQATNSIPTESGLSGRYGIAPGVKTERFRAEELDLHPATLARARSRGHLGFLRVGDKVYYSREHIEQWLARNERPAAAIKAGADQSIK